LLSEIEKRLDEFPRGETRFARWVLKNPEASSTLTIQELAEKSSASEPTIVRFSKRIGFKGFREFKAKLVEYIQQEKQKEKTSPPKPPQDPFLADQFRLNRNLKNLQESVLQSLSSQDLKLFLHKLIEAKHVLLLVDPTLKEVGDIVCRELQPFLKRLSYCAQDAYYPGMLGRLTRADMVLALYQHNHGMLKTIQQAKSKKIYTAVCGQRPVESPVDVFLGTDEFSDYTELSVLISLAQWVELLQNHNEEAKANLEAFQIKEDVDLISDPLKQLQGELWG
jgi:DNA-binding MurR/RpiR family transcriptional regulator